MSDAEMSGAEDKGAEVIDTELGEAEQLAHGVVMAQFEPLDRDHQILIDLALHHCRHVSVWPWSAEPHTAQRLTRHWIKKLWPEAWAQGRIEIITLDRKAPEGDALEWQRWIASGLDAYGLYQIPKSLWSAQAHFDDHPAGAAEALLCLEDDRERLPDLGLQRLHRWRDGRWMHAAEEGSFARSTLHAQRLSVPVTPGKPRHSAQWGQALGEWKPWIAPAVQASAVRRVSVLGWGNQELADALAGALDTTACHIRAEEAEVAARAETRTEVICSDDPLQDVIDRVLDGEEDLLRAPWHSTYDLTLMRRAPEADPVIRLTGALCMALGLRPIFVGPGLDEAVREAAQIIASLQASAASTD